MGVFQSTGGLQRLAVRDVWKAGLLSVVESVGVPAREGEGYRFEPKAVDGSRRTRSASFAARDTSGSLSELKLLI